MLASPSTGFLLPFLAWLISTLLQHLSATEDESCSYYRIVTYSWSSTVFRLPCMIVVRLYVNFLPDVPQLGHSVTAAVFQNHLSVGHLA
jgi:hypothetical protein